MLYVLLPVFNEEAHIEKLLREIDAVVSAQPHKIVIVNDGSTDNTVQIAQKMAMPNVVILTHRINLSIGAVFSTGIQHILQEAMDDDVLVLMESDLTSPPTMITALQQEVQRGKDVVIASRYLEKGGYKNFPAQRTMLSFGANYLMRYFFPLEDAHDYTIFLRGYRVRLLREVFGFFGVNCLQTKGFVSNVELLIKCSLFTRKIGEIPFVYNYVLKKNPSKLRVLVTTLEYFSFVFYMREIIRKVELRRGPAPASLKA